MKKGDSIKLEITDINNLGCGVGRYGGKVVFVKGAVTGDEISATVIKDNKSYCAARLDEIISASPYRTAEELCSAPMSCGGCSYRHITYEHEKQIKYGFVRSAFDKVGLRDVKVLPVISTEQLSGYRNKAQYPVLNTKKGLTTGFYAAKTHNIIPCDNCGIQSPEFAPITKAVCRLCGEYGISAYDEKSGQGFLRHIYLRIGKKTGEVMLCLVINADALPHEKEIADRLVGEFPSLVSVSINVNKENTNAVLGEKFRILFGRAYIEDELCGLRFRISADSFYQVNRDGAELLYTLAADAAELDGTQTLCDLYCGTGTIGLSVARRAKTVTGIEIVPAAVECAKQNAELNGIKNAEFFCADAGNAENILSAMHGRRPDTVIIDPPRKGSTRELCNCLSELGVPKIVYVSCSPTTLARDCVWFSEAGYDIGAVQPVDMFPRTGHVETVVCLSKK